MVPRTLQAYWVRQGFFLVSSRGDGVHQLSSQSFVPFFLKACQEDESGWWVSIVIPLESTSRTFIPLLEIRVLYELVLFCSPGVWMVCPSRVQIPLALTDSGLSYFEHCQVRYILVSTNPTAYSAFSCAFDSSSLSSMHPRPVPTSSFACFWLRGPCAVIDKAGTTCGVADPSAQPIRALVRPPQGAGIKMLRP